MSHSWRHRDPRRKKKYYRGKETTNNRLPITDLLINRLRIIEGYEEAHSMKMTTERYDRQFGLGNIERFELRKQGLIEQRDGNIHLTSKARVLINHSSNQ